MAQSQRMTATIDFQLHFHNNNYIKYNISGRLIFLGLNAVKLRLTPYNSYKYSVLCFIFNMSS